MGDQYEEQATDNGFPNIAREGNEVLLHILAVTLHLSSDRGKEILQAPACHHGIDPVQAQRSAGERDGLVR